MIAAALLIVLGAYLACGLVFAVPFVLFGVKRIDPHAAHGSWGFRLLIFPGTMALWPLLARRWIGGVTEPPEEDNAHRRKSKVGRSVPAEPAQDEQAHAAQWGRFALPTPNRGSGIGSP